MIMPMPYTHANLIFKDSNTQASVYVGNMKSAKDATFFLQNHIGAVVNATPDVPLYFKDRGVEYKHIIVDDFGTSKDMNIMYNALPDILVWMHTQMKNGKNILVHCHAGMQRSAAIVAAYMMKYYQKPLKFVVPHIVRNRPIAFSFGRNVNFIGPLRKFERKLKLA